MKTITTASVKGGVGKTSLTTHLGQAIYKMGYRVLLIDSDPNNNLTDFHLRNLTFEEINSVNLYHVVKGEISPVNAIYHTELGPDIIPCTLELTRIGIEMAGNPGGILRFARAISSLEYDYVLIDTPPFLSYEFRMGLYTADLVITPVSFSRWTLQALQLLHNEIREVEAAFDKIPQLLVVPSNVTDSEHETLKHLEIEFSENYIKKTASVKNANDKGLFLRENTRSWQDFISLAGEILYGKK